MIIMSILICSILCILRYEIEMKLILMIYDFYFIENYKKLLLLKFKSLTVSEVSMNVHNSFVQ